ncbi:hypothetical protein FRC12_000860, partial [Ceratobasidium sp. 428]
MSHSQVSPAPPPAAPVSIKLHDMTLEKMHYKLYRTGYLTCDEFLGDIEKMVRNAQIDYNTDQDRWFKAES